MHHIDKCVHGVIVAQCRCPDARRVQILELICPMCKNSFLCRIDNDYRSNRKKGRSGPYCSKSCAGKVR